MFAECKGILAVLQFTAPEKLGGYGVRVRRVHCWHLSPYADRTQFSRVVARICAGRGRSITRISFNVHQLQSSPKLLYHTAFCHLAFLRCESARDAAYALTA